MIIKTALITGAGSGIGLAFAKSLARIGSDLVLTSKDEEKLIKLKDELESKYGNKVWIIAYDLTLSESIEQIIQFLNGNKIHPELIINNAGIGMYGKFDKTDESREIQIIQINIVALTRLTKVMVKRMSENGGGTVLNVASTIAFRKSPKWSVYAASKSYVWSFSRSLELEYRNSPIRIAVLCPGKTDTDFDRNADVQTDEGVYSTKKGDSPEYVADYTIKKLRQNKKIIIPGFKNKLKYFLFKFFPDFITDVILKSI
jgi:uncharacterized protein